MTALSLRLGLCLLAGVIPAAALAQTSNNMTLVGSLDHRVEYNDIWGYTDEFGDEYALLGITDGTSVIDITDPGAPVETFFLPGPSSPWRDIKTFGDYAYVVTEGAGGGLQIIDLTDPQNPIALPSYTGFSTAHNIYIDEANARAYACGVNPGITDPCGGATLVGGVHILDLTNPAAPVGLGTYDTRYVHDLYVRDNIMYLAEIFNGSISIVDVNDPCNPIQLTPQPITYAEASTHNTWVTDNGDYLLTSDERGGGRLHIWDITDLNDVQQVAQWQTPETNSSIHNVLIRNDRAYLSYYTEGTRVIDISNPLAPAEIAHVDDYTLPSGGFDGVWGVYPFLPSGLVLSSDITEGLLIYDVGENFALLTGQVTEAGVGGAISNATVSLQGTAVTATTGVGGFYTIITSPGAYTLDASAYAFFDSSQPANLAQGSQILDLSLTRRPNGQITGIVRDDALQPLSDARVEIVGEPFVMTTDTDGSYLFTQVPVGAYVLRAVRAGYGHHDTPIQIIPAGGVRDIELVASPIYDPADSASGWTLGLPSDDAFTGEWIHADPVATGSGFVQPEDDATPAPSSGLCFVTGNGDVGGTIGQADVDGGVTTLVSPTLDLSAMTDPYLAYSRWYINEAGSAPGTDVFTVQYSDDGGAGWSTLETLNQDASPWTRVFFRLSDFGVTNFSQIRVRFLAEDASPGSIVEAAIDDLEAYEVSTPTAAPSAPRGLVVRLAPANPNPFNPSTQIEYELSQSGRVELTVFDLRGRRIRTLVQDEIEAGSHRARWEGNDSRGQAVASGVYLVRLSALGTTTTRKLVLAK